MRIFADTNVLASALGTRGLCSDLLEVVIEQHQLVVSELVLKELKRVLLRKFHVPADRVEAVDLFLRGYEIVPPPRRPPRFSGLDRGDAIIFGAASEGRCDIFVTGDRELLAAVRNRTTLRALNPRDCWRLLRA